MVVTRHAALPLKQEERGSQIGRAAAGSQTVKMDIVGFSRMLAVLGCAAAVLGLGLAALLGAFGGGGLPPSSAPTTTSTSNVTVGFGPGVSAQSIRIAVPNVVGEIQEQATEKLASLGLGTSAVNEYPTGGRPNGTVVSQTPSPGSKVAPGSVVAIKVVGGDYGSSLP